METLNLSDEAWKFFLPNNFFYVALEFIQYKFNPNHKIFLSLLELEQFRKVYGPSLFDKRCFVVYPVLSANLLGEKQTRLYDLESPRKRFVFIGHNFRVKRLSAVISLLEGLRLEGIDLELEVLGSDLSWAPESKCADWVFFKGMVPYSAIDWSQYDSLVLLSVSESYAFVVQEALYHSLVPVVTKSVGAGEHAAKLGLPHVVTDPRPEDFSVLSERLKSALRKSEVELRDWHVEAWRDYSDRLIMLLKS